MFADIISLWEFYAGYDILFQLEMQIGDVQRNCTVAYLNMRILLKPQLSPFSA